LRGALTASQFWKGRVAEIKLTKNFIAERAARGEDTARSSVSSHLQRAMIARGASGAPSFLYLPFSTKKQKQFALVALSLCLSHDAGAHHLLPAPLFKILNQRGCTFSRVRCA
jgi:hypothetical protein